MLKSKADVVPELMDGMLDDCTVDVRSTWQDNIPSTISTPVMTVPLPVNSVSIQTTEREDEGTQTEENPQPDKQVKKATASLNKFVSRATDLVVDEFVRVEEEHTALEPLSRGADIEQEPAECIFELCPFNQSTNFPSGDSGSLPIQSWGGGLANASTKTAGNSPRKGGMDGGVGGGVGSVGKVPGGSHGGAHKKLVVTSLSWSCTGSTIAASYGRYDIAGWCTDRGALVTWNLGRENVKQNKPDVMIDVDVCLMACAFHPEHPALIAGGSFNGDLYVWDLAKEGDPQRGRSDVLCEVRHQEPICSISWQYSLTEAGKYGNRAQAYRLVTLGADGRIIVWIWHKLDVPLYGYQLLWPAPGLDRKILWGGTCMDFARDGSSAMAGTKSQSQSSSSNPSPSKRGGGGGGSGGGADENVGSTIGSSTFMVGTEGGRVFRCFFDVNDMGAKDFQKALMNGDRMELRCPIKDAGFESHAGAVYGLQCSPFQRDVFVTGGADGNCRVYHTLRQQPLLILEPCGQQILSTAWSLTRPLVLSASSADGHVYIYDFLQSRDIIRPVLVLDAAPQGGSVFCQAFNAKKSDMFATGNSSSILIWKLPVNIATSRKGEAALLRRIANADDATEAVRSMVRKGGF